MIKYLPDRFSCMIVAMLILATILPIHGEAASIFNTLTNCAIALLFFLHGAKLSREAIYAGLTHWRLHLTIFTATFVLFPILGLALKPILEPVLGHSMYLGILYLCLLPSTVQSSIAFTSIARGNVSAALCSASASNILGMFITPCLVGLFLVTGSSSQPSFSFTAILNIISLLFIPFVFGQIFSKKIRLTLLNHPTKIKIVDQGSILMVVYAAFSEAVIEGVWTQVATDQLIVLAIVCMALLFTTMLLIHFSSKKLGFNRADQITILFCGSKKTLASGVPMAKILFASHAFGLIILPLMLFHQIQLITCGILANRFAQHPQQNIGHK